MENIGFENKLWLSFFFVYKIDGRLMLLVNQGNKIGVLAFAYDHD